MRTWSKSNKADLSGRLFGRWTVIQEAAPVKRQGGGIRRHWFCRCACGVTRSVPQACLTHGESRSCGCLSKELAAELCLSRNTTHGLSGSPEYGIWVNMKTRCLNPGVDAFRHYGGRGIAMCDEWRHSFQKFFEYVGPRPSIRHSIERIDNNRGYEPGNVSWALPIVQGSNKRNNVRLSAKGETLILAEWARRSGLDPEAIRKRLKSGWPVERAVSERSRLARAAS